MGGVPPADRKSPKRAASSESQYTLLEFMKDFPDDETCLVWLWNTRYANEDGTAYCTKCEKDREFKRYGTDQQRQSWTCTGCGLHVHPTAGTIFHKSSTSLQLWFYAMYLMTSTRCGISAKQLERELGVTYKTAWRMMHLIRNELMDQDDGIELHGEVEMDETYVGGKRRGGRPGQGQTVRGRPRADDSKKVPVFGMVERGGRVRAMTTPNVQAATVMPQVRKHVLPATTVFTDEYQIYNAVGHENEWTHHRIKHREGIYVSGAVHTNTIEGFWSLVKNGIRGVYHAVSAKHLQGYLNEYVWRYNRRDDGQAMFLTLILRSALSTAD